MSNANAQHPTAGKAGIIGGVAAILLLAASIVGPFEGRVNGTYRDVVNVLTACDGHTGPDIVEGKKYTNAECDAFTREDLSEAYSHVRRCIKRDDMPNEVAAAFTSATYNLGPVIVCKSTLSRMANAGDYAGACRQLTHAKVRRKINGQWVTLEHGWTYAGGVRYRGLIRRRAAERAVCEQGLQRG